MTPLKYFYYIVETKILWLTHVPYKPYNLLYYFYARNIYAC